MSCPAAPLPRASLSLVHGMRACFAGWQVQTKHRPEHHVVSARLHVRSRPVDQNGIPRNSISLPRHGPPPAARGRARKRPDVTRPILTQVPSFVRRDKPPLFVAPSKKKVKTWKMGRFTTESTLITGPRPCVRWPLARWLAGFWVPPGGIQI
ncbi:hypothetical protein B0T11DRAFT_49848 [Plectosphaerella cucumerina]|uniref:Uncharacterized protein n=1 Tax=Plectosphaerella cucumerina TaxID=40658 RepID=A0A8K0TK37_9PEZI|nr:hypothetical protein B0T11DRAFT_49848 [Plectosphaerella cucumerina]